MSVVINGTGSISGLSNVGGVSSAQAGNILQVVTAQSNTPYSTTSNVWLSTNLSATITPQSTSSRILVLTCIPDAQKGNDATYASGAFRITRNGSAIYYIGGYIGYTGTNLTNYFSTTGIYVDTPASTSALTYLVQMSNELNSGTIFFAPSGTAAVNTITLLEIA